jgi:hypothetical protein
MSLIKHKNWFHIILFLGGWDVKMGWVEREREREREKCTFEKFLGNFFI